VWVALQFMGADFDGSTDTSVDFDVSEGSGSSDVSFTLLSFQGLSSFLTMFGLIGLAAHREGHLSSFLSLGVAIAAGLTLSWALGRLFAMFNSLQSSGTIRMEAAVGQEGTVYLTLPGGGEGKVELTVQGRLQVLPAVTESEERIETGARVLVVRINDGRTLVVTRI
jgi:membrane protein implicated in regulation of membrane protease activity